MICKGFRGVCDDRVSVAAKTGWTEAKNIFRRKTIWQEKSINETIPRQPHLSCKDIGISVEIIEKGVNVILDIVRLFCYNNRKHYETTGKED